MENLIDFPANPITGDDYFDPSGDRWVRHEKSWVFTINKESNQAGFVTTWNIISNNETVTLPLVEGFEYNFIVNWGDGTSDTIISWDQAEKAHTYIGAGVYDITISGVCQAWNFTGSADAPKVTDVKRLGKVGWTSLEGAFNGCTNLATFEVGISDTTLVTSTKQMFKECVNLLEFIPETFSTVSVIDMSQMFYECSNMITIDLTLLSTDLVTDMSGMFFNCAAVTALDVSGFSTALVTDFSNMFNGNSALTGLDVSGFSTIAALDMSYMFQNCSLLTVIDVSGFSTALVTNISYMFNGCKKVITLDVSGFITTSITTFAYLFNDCQVLYGVDVSSFNTAAANDLSFMFGFCAKLDALSVSSFNTTLVTNLDGTFSECAKLKTFDISSWDVSNLLTAVEMMKGTYIYSDSQYDPVLLAWAAQTVQPNVIISFGDVKYIDYVSRAVLTDAPNSWIITDGGSYRPFLIDVTPAIGIMLETTTHIINGNWFTPTTSVTTDQAFTIDSVTYLSPSKLSITVTGLGQLETGNLTVKNGVYTSYGASLSIEISYSADAFVFVWKPDVTWREMELPTYGTGDFLGSDFNFDYHVDWGDGTSSDCVGYDDPNRIHVYGDTNEHMVVITGLYESQKFENHIYITNWRRVLNLGNVGWKSLAWSFYGMTYLTSFDAGTCNTSLVTSMERTFGSGGNILSFSNMDSMDVSNVTTMYATFSGCSNITSMPNIDSWDMSKVTTMHDMFYNCYDITTIDMSNWKLNPNGVTMTHMFNSCGGILNATLPLQASAITDMSWMFQSAFENNDWQGNFFGQDRTFTQCTTIEGMFYLSNVENVNLTNAKFPAITRAGRLFENCQDMNVCSLTGCELSGSNSFWRMFYNNYEMVGGTLDLSTINTTNSATDMRYMFYFCRVAILDMSTFDMAGCSSTHNMFDTCNDVTLDVDVSSWNMESVGDMYYMFKGFRGTLTGIENWNPKNCNSMNAMFRESGITSVDMSNWDVSKVTTFYQMFYKAASLTTANMTGWTTTALQNMQYMFYQCGAFVAGAETHMGNWDITNLTDSGAQYAFDNTWGFNTAWYDDLLIGWGAQTLNNVITTNFHTEEKYSAGAAATGRANLTAQGFTFFDAGQI